MYNYEVELVMKSYMPKHLEEGMLFADTAGDGVLLFELKTVPSDEERFLVMNGAPVELFIIDSEDESIIAEPHEIGWLDEGEDVDELREVTLDDINYILNECEGFLEIQIEEDMFDEEEMIIPIMYEQKVVISFLQEEEDE